MLVFQIERGQYQEMLEAPHLIRPFNPQDLSAVIEINRVCLPENYSPYFFMEVFKSCPEGFIVAESSTKVVGYIMCRVEFGFSDTRRFRMARKGHIVSVAVLPEFRKQGIGRELVEVALKALAANGGEECFLEVRTANEDAVRLYRELSFDIVRTIPHYYHDGADAFLMSIRLTRSQV
ncbi:MAG TPA: N-acetyltransferase [Candidatus Binatus sp.]|nr:N-acetyltransferase [Candidatus Binatus sp.]